MIDSWGSIDCVFPKDTELKTDAYIICENGKDMFAIYDDFYDQYSNHVLDDLVAFFGRPLDKVPGLELHVSFETCEEGFFKMELDIVDGKVTYRESRIVMEERPICKSPFDFGQPNIEKARRAWDELEDVCVDDDGCIDEDFYSCSLMRFYRKGTDREDIWHDIEDFLGVSVAYLMGESKKPFFAE